MKDIHKEKEDFDKSKDPIQELWNQRGSENSEDLPDQIQKKLELDSILSYIKPNHTVIDLGCGNGKVPLAISDVAREVLGVEYAPEILKKALPLAKENLSFCQGDVRELEGISSDYYDIAISERSLINLNNLKEQSIAIDQIHRVLKSGGKYLMLETSKQGIERLSFYRQKFNLSPIKVPWHNLPIDDEWLFAYTKDKFAHIQTVFFDTYFLITRILHPLYVAPEQPSYTNKLNVIASQISKQIPDFNGEMSQIKLHILEKK